MWNYRTCPICDGELELVDFYKREIRLRCIQSTIPAMEGCSQREVLSSWAMPKYHFETLIRDFQPFHETMVMYPFIIDSYQDVTNISVYDKYNLHHFVVEIPHYLDLPWHSLDKVKDKLKLYVLMS